MISSTGSSSFSWCLVAMVVTSRMHDHHFVPSATNIVPQQAMVVANGGSKLGILVEVVDFELQVASKHFHRDTAAVGVPHSGVVELTRDLPSTQGLHCLCDRQPAGAGLGPVLEFVVHQPVF